MVAMGSGQLDAAWMGPWGYVIANNATDCQAIATVKYDDKPTYQAIIVARPDLAVARFPDDTRGRSISFADVGSTVQRGQTLCIVEAMKLFNELEADFPCVIEAVLIDNAQPVEYGTRLFRVRKL